MRNMILFDAIYLFSLGGKKLLKLIYNSLNENLNSQFILDDRLKSDYINFSNNLFIKANIFFRFLFYIKNINSFSTIFCFANIPPPFRVNKRVFIFFHNDNLINPKYSNLLLNLKSIYIRLINDDCYKWIVQTNYMKNRLNFFFNIKLDNIFVIPIFDDSKSVMELTNKRNDFLYVSDFQPHKNHDNLIKAFLLYSNKSESQINLHLTIPNNKYDSFIKKYVIPQNLNIVNHGVCDESQINDLYSKCKYFIFPSIKESFGLPLIEACQYDCHVIASNLEYVTEIIKPSLLFDPLNIDSIATSIEIALNTKSLKTSKILVKNKLDLLIETIEQNV